MYSKMRSRDLNIDIIRDMSELLHYDPKDLYIQTIVDDGIIEVYYWNNGIRTRKDIKLCDYLSYTRIKTLKSILDDSE